ncbi:hypothetical protein [Actibacterium sp.]|uniref:hypothetical protein n=1 Tax=Actibacterium sp. TaxID=1872125 RepID=UPI00356B2638
MLRKTILTLLLCAGPVWAQNMTTAAEVRPILEMTKGNWIAVREYDGRDLLYFTHIASFRCGVAQVEYRVNDGPAQLFGMEPCYDDEASPNALKLPSGELPYVGLPLGSVEQVEVTLTFDDGSTDTASYERAAIQIN